MPRDRNRRRVQEFAAPQEKEVRSTQNRGLEQADLEIGLGDVWKAKRRNSDGLERLPVRHWSQAKEQPY